MKVASWENGRMGTEPRRRLPIEAVCLMLCLAALVALPGCGGCRQDPMKAREEAEKKAAEERARQKEKPKPDFEVTRLATRPSDRRPTSDPDPLGPPCKPGHWTGVTLAGKTNNFDFVGDLEIVATNSRGTPLLLENAPFELATSRQVSLPKREPKLFESIMYVPPSRQQALVSYRLNWRKGGRRALESSHRLSQMPSYQYHFAVLARWPARYTYLANLPAITPPSDGLSANPTKPYYRVALMPGDRRPLLPSQGLLWTSIAYVLWDDAEPGSLTLDQQQGLLDWLHWGGQLIISGPDSLDSLGDCFLTPYLPAKSTGARELGEADFQPLHAWANDDKVEGKKSVPPLAPTRPLTGVQIEPHPQAEFVADSGDLLIQRRVGRGRIVVSAFRLSGRDLTTWPGLDEMFNAFLLRRPPRRFFETKELDLRVVWADRGLHRLDAAHVSKLRYFTRDTGVEFGTYGTDVRYQNVDFDSDPMWGPGVAAWNDAGPVADSARTALRNAAQIEIPTRSFVLWILAGYLAVLVPANWAVFRLAGRVEWAWAAAPVIAIVCTIVVIRAAQLDIGFARSQTEVTVLELQADYPRAHATRYTALYTSLTTEYDVHADNPGTLVLAFPKTTGPGDDSERRGLIYRRNGKNASLEDYFVRSNSIGMVHSEQMVDVGGTLSLVETPGGGLQVFNQTEFSLHDAGVVRMGASGSLETAWVGSLEPGAKSPLRFVRPVASPSDGSLWKEKRTDPTLTGIGLPQGTLNLRPLARLAEGRAVDQQNRTIGELQPGEVRLIAGLKQRAAGPVVDPAAPQTQFGTLVVAHLRHAADATPRPDKNTLADLKRNSAAELDPADPADAFGESGF